MTNYDMDEIERQREREKRRKKEKGKREKNRPYHPIGKGRIGDRSRTELERPPYRSTQ